MKWGRCSTYVQQKSKIKMAGVWWNQAKCFDTIIFSKDGWPRESYRHIILCIHMSYTVYTVCIDQPYRTPKRCPRSTFLLTAAPGVFCHVTWLRWSMATMPSRLQSGKMGLGLLRHRGQPRVFWCEPLRCHPRSRSPLDPTWASRAWISSEVVLEQITAQFGGVEPASDVGSWLVVVLSS